MTQASQVVRIIDWIYQTKISCLQKEKDKMKSCDLIDALFQAISIFLSACVLVEDLAPDRWSQ